MSQDLFPYLHGFSEKEQNRLRDQARFIEQILYRDVDFSYVENLLEVGCGVGAQTEILLRRFPDITIKGIDINEHQLQAAQTYLGSKVEFSGRYDLQKMDASNMDFRSKSYDGAFLCWVLEHVSEPKRILSEVRRVLKPGAIVYVTEVMNSSLFLDPYSPNVWKYWMAFNDYQYESAGDPFVGAKLGNLMTSVGFVDVTTQPKTWHIDNRHPEKRTEVIQYWMELLLSASDQLIEAGYTTKEVVDAVKTELNLVSRDPNAVYFYSFMQSHARVI